MAGRALAYAAALVAASAAAILWACGDRPSPLDATPQTDTGKTAQTAADRFYRAQKDRIPHALATNPGEPWGDYVGSRSCQPCHQKDYDDWRNSFHSRTLYDAAPATVFGDFSGDRRYDSRVSVPVPGQPETKEIKSFPFSARPFREGGNFYMHVTLSQAPGISKADIYGNGVPRKPVGVWQVIYAFGNRRHQPYVARDEDGRYWILPYYWNDVAKTWMLDGWRPYVMSCANCHVTGIKSLEHSEPGSLELPSTVPQRWSPGPASEGWAEGAVGCEVCHGPARAHVVRARTLGDAAYRKFLADGGSSEIYCPGRDTPEMRMKQCDSCHNFDSESTVTWVPGPRGYDHEMFSNPITPERAHGQFYEDGTDMSPCTVGRVFRSSKMGKMGVECRDCHSSHGNASFGSLVKPLAGNQLCLTCHGKDYGTKEQLVAHTHHAADGVGSSCVECHMPRDKRFTNGVQVMSAQIPSHIISIPTGDPRPGGPEPSCNTCHTDRDYTWTRRQIETWWPFKDTKKPAGK